MGWFAGFEKTPHILEPVAVSAELVLNGLVVADVGEHLVKNTQAASLMNRDEYSALQHDLQQTYCFQCDALSTGIGS